MKNSYLHWFEEIGRNDVSTVGGKNASELAELFDERDEAVKWMIVRLIKTAYEFGREVGICGQALRRLTSSLL